MASASEELAQRLHTVHHLEQVMGTVVTIDIYVGTGGSDLEVFSRLEQALDVLHDADHVFSTWKSDSSISHLRRGEITLDQAPAVVGDVLEACRVARALSEGWFDPWAMRGGVDPTGFVKGWAAQRALQVLAAPGIPGAIVNAAGDIASFGGPGEASTFRFGIVDPFSHERLACIVGLVGALATSGTYEQGLHLVDPHSGQPITRVASASVCGPDLGLADALATGLAVAGDPGLAVIEGIEGYEAMIIGLDGTWQWTRRFPFADGPALPPVQETSRPASLRDKRQSLNRSTPTLSPWAPPR